MKPSTLLDAPLNHSPLNGSPVNHSPANHSPLVALQTPERSGQRGFGHKWPARIGIMNDHVRVLYANGSSFASQFLYRELLERGHDVTIIGANDPEASERELPQYRVLFPSLPMLNHPGLHVPMPAPAKLRAVADKNLDVLLGQTGTAMLDLGVWLRKQRRVPFLCVNTVHLQSLYNTLLSDRLLASPTVNRLFSEQIVPAMERHTVRAYNQSDGLIVLSKALKQAWRERGVTVPIHVIPRCIEPKVFDAPLAGDPFPQRAARGQRLLCVCRHAREKGVARLIEVFARYIAPGAPHATLTLLGDGVDHAAFRAQAEQLGVSDRVFFPGEVSLREVPKWYRNADIFMYASLSETYGQVISEAMWCGLPVVALNDNMGVSHQIADGVDGVLVRTEAPTEHVNCRLGTEVLSLLNNPARRYAMAQAAVQSARERCLPSTCITRYYDAFEAARSHLERYPPRPSKGLYHITRWATLHTALAFLGCLRGKTELNRITQPPPTWDEYLGSSSFVAESIMPGELRGGDSALEKSALPAGA